MTGYKSEQRKEFSMKNKTIYIGKTGSGKSYTALEKILKNKGTKIIVNCAASKSRYEKAFPDLLEFEEKDGSYPFTVDQGGKYYVENHNKPFSEQKCNVTSILQEVVYGSDYVTVKDDETTMILFDDLSWNRVEDKFYMFWRLSHVKCSVAITIDRIDALLDLSESKITVEMINDIKMNWNIINMDL